jgi:hypothetical protein
MPIFLQNPGVETLPQNVKLFLREPLEPIAFPTPSRGSMLVSGGRRMRASATDSVTQDQTESTIIAANLHLDY